MSFNFVSKCRLNSNSKNLKSKVLNQRGQGLIEYIIIVSLVAVGSMALLQVLQQSLKYQFSNVAQALGAKVDHKTKAPEVNKSMLDKKDMNHFMQDVMSADKNDSAKKD